MTRSERLCAAMSTWMLRKIVASPLIKSMWAAAYLELWKREVADEILMATNDETGPWPCVMPPGMH